ncbi:MAG: aldo/keto reductase [DPANN group archaeon]|nr:aldo/keto reductase [DPANN group archaeon]
METFTLSNGVKIPAIGIGTYLSSPEAAYQAVRWALEIGYRHIDTAAYYQNEEAVGRAIRDSSVSREELFITTKLWHTDHGRAREAFQENLGRLGLEYADLYLIHWPLPGFVQAWDVLRELEDAKLCRAVGVSNFLPEHLEQLSSVPLVNQFECSPFLNQHELRAYCRKKGIQTESYSPLTRGDKLHDERIVSIAKAIDRTPAQVMLRWNLQHGNVILPKSTHRERIEENFRLDFTLSPEHMKLLDSMDEGFRKAPDPHDLAAHFGGRR